MKCNRLTSDVSNVVRKKEGKVNGNYPLGGREREREGERKCEVEQHDVFGSEAWQRMGRCLANPG